MPTRAEIEQARRAQYVAETQAMYDFNAQPGGMRSKPWVAAYKRDLMWENALGDKAYGVAGGDPSFYTQATPFRYNSVRADDGTVIPNPYYVAHPARRGADMLAGAALALAHHDLAKATKYGSKMDKYKAWVKLKRTRAKLS